MRISHALSQSLSPDELEWLRARLDQAGAFALDHCWPAVARAEQEPPAGDWTTWLFLGGRGAGKTRAGAEWICERVAQGAAQHVALVGATQQDVRSVMVEGESGLLKVARPWNRPFYEPSKRKLTWPAGAVATLYSAEEPEGLRGPQHDTAWCDELAKWNNAQYAWDNLQMGLRLGTRPQQMISTTPRPMALLRAIMARSDTVVTRGTTYDNRANLAPAFFAEVIRRYEGTRFGRQEINAEVLEDVAGALWTRAMLDLALMPAQTSVPETSRVVVGVDPSGTRGGDGRDSVGIVVAAKGADGLGYVLADCTCSLSPAQWAKRVADAAEKYRADCVVAESNFGGAMVESVLRAGGVKARVKMVSASRGKHVRAEPIAALYEQRRVRHASPLPQLEDQLCAFTGEGYAGEGSPDRADALVWALTELFVAQKSNAQGWIEFAQQSLAEKRKQGLVW